MHYTSSARWGSPMSSTNDRTSCSVCASGGCPCPRYGAECTLMDEPFAALDIQTRNKMQSFWPRSGSRAARRRFRDPSHRRGVSTRRSRSRFHARPGRIKTIVPIDVKDPRSARPRMLSATVNQRSPRWMRVANEKRRSGRHLFRDGASDAKGGESHEWPSCR